LAPCIIDPIVPAIPNGALILSTDATYERLCRLAVLGESAIPRNVAKSACELQLNDA